MIPQPDDEYTPLELPQSTSGCAADVRHCARLQPRTSGPTATWRRSRSQDLRPLSAPTRRGSNPQGRRFQSLSGQPVHSEPARSRVAATAVTSSTSRTTPPAGPERLFAVWTRQPLSLRLDQLHSLVERKNEDSPASRPYVATRDMKRVQQSVQQLRPEDWHAVVLELDHAS